MIDYYYATHRKKQSPPFSFQEFSAFCKSFTYALQFCITHSEAATDSQAGWHYWAAAALALIGSGPIFPSALLEPKMALSVKFEISLLLSPGRGAEYCDEFFCVSVCPRPYLWNRWTDLHGFFLCRSPVAVARSSSGGVAIYYLLPVLWVTSRLAVKGRMAMRGRMHL